VAPRAAAVGKGSQRFATDSLGMVRELASGNSSISREAAVADVLRALLMYGVIMDHFAGCADGSTCRLVMEDIVWQQPLEVQMGLKWVDTAVRMVGNYKAMAGFLMVSAYVDSGYARSTYWGRGDAVALLTYLQMIWLLDPLIFSICAPILPERCSATDFWYAGVHRWYLLAMLLTKLILVVMRLARFPPLLQCVLVSLLAFGLPPEVGCLTEERCESTSANDLALWRGSLQCDPASPLACARVEDGLRTLLAPVWKLLFQGPYADSWSMFSSILMRYYLLFVAIYIWTFHYGRPCVEALSALVRQKGCSLAATRVARLAALVGLLATELVQAALIGPDVYNLLQQNYIGTFTPALLPTLGVLLLLVLAVLLLLAAVGADPRPWRVVRLAGSTTLGCYVVHLYFTLPLSLTSGLLAALPTQLGAAAGLVVQLFLLAVVPMVFQLTIGAAFHRLLMLEMRLIFWLVACAARAATHVHRRCRGSHSDPEAPSTGECVKGAGASAGGVQLADSSELMAAPANGSRDADTELQVV